MTAKPRSYWAKRCIRTGRYMNGGRTLTRTVQDALEAGIYRATPSDRPPEDCSEEAETIEFIRMLPVDWQRLFHAAYVDNNAARKYGRSQAELSAMFLSVNTVKLNRLLRQRQRGEPLDPNRVSRKPRVSFTKLDGKHAAAVAD